MIFDLKHFFIHLILQGCECILVFIPNFRTIVEERIFLLQLLLTIMSYFFSFYVSHS